MARTVDDCIFCKIARHELAARIVYEDDDIVAFDDITPQGPVHTLVVPKEHFDDLGDDVPPEIQAALLDAVAKVAEMKGVSKSGYRVIINNGPHATQSVCHLHMHVIGGAQMSHGMVLYA